MGLVALASPYNRRGDCQTSGYSLISADIQISWKMKLWIGLQSILGAIRLYLNYACLQYLPLGGM